MYGSWSRWIKPVLPEERKLISCFKVTQPAPGGVWIWGECSFIIPKAPSSIVAQHKSDSYECLQSQHSWKTRDQKFKVILSDTVSLRQGQLGIHQLVF